MKKMLAILLLFTVGNAFSQNAFTTGEYFKFRIHYGIVNAGYATLEVKDAVRNGKKVYHVVGKGRTTGMTKFFFKVEDNYESYFDKKTITPYQYVRKIDEGGYTKDQEGFFNQANNTVLVKDYKNKKEKTLSVPAGVQDMVSTFYYLRNHPGVDKMKIGEFIAVDMFFDDETTKFKLKFIGREEISTKFGNVSTMIFRPYVQAGRVFKEEESLTVWISDDENKIPLRIKASLAVGSLKADLMEYKGLKYPFEAK
ncbi:DUF3108 domain-containing protein [Flavobacterium salilacus subsp. salilacus]|uniref:DUF3108 domain-containing protein n=1 Tax=Flavobacterium TaxID=237 RepID=UPI001074CCDD|nr:MULTISPECIES: DUF3108 domain-containing protein [Flavobacterium]KAF2518296.1 DUF3108 domain-containing protein [Flavobacterium salilacus subsp. salilacus]MBE1615290.1 DUF3108 domain-containing protein [Flavobacterium sp. SaA2.13]